MTACDRCHARTRHHRLRHHTRFVIVAELTTRRRCLPNLYNLRSHSAAPVSAIVLHLWLAPYAPCKAGITGRLPLANKTARIVYAVLATQKPYAA